MLVDPAGDQVVGVAEGASHRGAAVGDRVHPDGKLHGRLDEDTGAVRHLLRTALQAGGVVRDLAQRYEVTPGERTGEGGADLDHLATADGIAHRGGLVHEEDETAGVGEADFGGVRQLGDPAPRARRGLNATARGVRGNLTPQGSRR